MDIRIEKTRRAIQNSFLAIRSRKDIEQITIKELCEAAEINKSTFYSHFSDIYALADHMETEAVASVLISVSTPTLFFEDPYSFNKELMEGYISVDALLSTLFSGSRQSELVKKIDHSLRHMILDYDPGFNFDPHTNVLLTYAIYGSYYAYIEAKKSDNMKLLDDVCHITEGIMKML